MSTVAQKQNIKFQRTALIIGIGLMIIKFIAYFITGSNAILTDALESIINVLAGAFGLYSIILAAKPKDKDHPYGHGKIEFISASVEGSLILFAGISIVLKSLHNFFNPQEINDIQEGFYLITLAGLVNLILGIVLKKRGTKHNSTTMIASGEHLLSDAWSTLGLIIGIIFIWFTGEVWIDNLVALIFGAFIAFQGYKIVRNSVGGIMDEADFEILEKSISILNNNRSENWIDVHNLRIIKFGDIIHIDGHLTIPWYFNARQVHDELELFDKVINENIPNSVEFFIHTDPCLPSSCAICIKNDCPAREKKQEKKLEWSLNNVLSNQKHSESTE